MEKLGKKIKILDETIESYTTCHCHCHCGCNCDCDDEEDSHSSLGLSEMADESSDELGVDMSDDLYS